MYPEQGSNPFSLQCQAGFYPFYHRGSPWSLILKPGLCLDPKSYRAACKVNSHKTMIHNLFSKTHLSLSCPSRTLCKKYIISRGTPQICSPTAAIIHFSFSFALLASNPFKKWPGILLLVTFTPKLFLLSSPSKNQELVRNSSWWGKKEKRKGRNTDMPIVLYSCSPFLNRKN